MSLRVVECVPNFSEGRDLAKIKVITDAIEAVAGVRLLDVDPGADTNRTVVTFVGDPDQVVEAAFQAVKTAAQVLDMTTHQGAHPRMGATDVCPFVPVEGVTLEDCAELARRLGKRVGAELGIPVYLYEHAASRPERQQPGRGAQGRVRGPRGEAEGSRLGTRLRPGRLPRQGGRPDHGRPGIPHRLQRHPELPRQGPRHGHRLRAAGEGPGGPARSDQRLLQQRQGAEVRRGLLPLRQLRPRCRHLRGAGGPLPGDPRLRPAPPAEAQRHRRRQGRRGPEGLQGRPLHPVQGHRLVRGHLQARPALHQPHQLQGDRPAHRAGSHPQHGRGPRPRGDGQRDRGPGALPGPLPGGSVLPAPAGQVALHPGGGRPGERRVLHGPRGCGPLRAGEEGAGPAQGGQASWPWWAWTSWTK